MKFFATLFLLASTAFAGWSSSGPTGGAVAIVVAAPSDPKVVWAGNSAGVFRSTDGGATWANVSGPVVEVVKLVVHPNDANKAWALTGFTPVSRVWRTSDGGATWIDSTDGLPSLRPTALLIDPRDPNTLYVGSKCEPFFRPVSGPAAFPAAGVFKSTNGGVTWTPILGGFTTFEGCAEELSLDPFSPWRLFVAAPSPSVSKESYDNGRTWEKPDSGRPSLAVVFDARFPFTHYGITGNFGFNSAVFVSQDGGFTWNDVGAKPPAQPTSLSMDPEHSRIFLGTTNGVFRSGNGGTVWAPTSVPNVGVSAIDFGGEPRSLFAATLLGLLRVDNRGLGDTQRIDLHDIAANVSSIAVDPHDSNVLYAGTRDIGVNNQTRGRTFRSTDGGASWERLPNDDDRAKDFLAVDAAGTLYGAAYSGGVSRYDANGWTQIFDGGATDVAADPKNAGTVLASMSASVWRTRDGGRTWARSLDNHYGGHIAIDPSDPRWVYVGNEYELWRSSDGGNTWTNLFPTYSVDNGSRALVVAPSNGTVLYRIGSNGGRPRSERSDDRGATWTPVPLPGEPYPSAIAVDPHNEYSVWVATFNGAIYHSANGGFVWEKVDTPFLTATSAVALRFDASGHTLHVAWPSHGVWELSVD
jgi:photosystem II stability/assembly factor-like uncharacterized protein